MCNKTAKCGEAVRRSRGVLRGRLTARGFTLLELVLVITIVVVLVGMAVPRLRGHLEVANYNAASRLIIRSLQYAHGLAVSRQVEARVVFDLDTRLFWVDLARETEGEKEFYRPGTSLASPQDLPEKLNLMCHVYGDWEDSGKVAATFYPNGTADGVTLKITNDQGDGKTVRIAQSTAYIQVKELEL